MNRSHIIRRIATAGAAVGFAVVLSAPAQADPPALSPRDGNDLAYFETSFSVRPDDRAVRGLGSVATRVSDDPVRPDDRAGRMTAPPGKASPVRSNDRADRRLPTVSVEERPASTDGFHWIDAGIGAAAAFGLALLAVSASVVGLRHRRTAALS
jgi:hypothetical protein